METLPPAPSPFHDDSHPAASRPRSVGSVSSAGGKKKGPTVAPKRGAKKIKYVEALYTYEAGGEGEASMDEGERLVLIGPDQGDGWCEVERQGDKTRGVVPASWVKEV